MTAREALQAIVERTIEEVRYSPVDLIKAIALLDQMEQREKRDQPGAGMQNLLDALEKSARAVANIDLDEDPLEVSEEYED